MADATPRPVALIVLDGWGYRTEREGNAVALATVPTWDRLWARSPRTILAASGLRVGLPEGQIGNSEVGHLNLGAGRVVKQDLVRIDEAIADRSLFENRALLSACRTVRDSGGTLHLLGLLGNGGVHSVDRHLWALLDLTQAQGVTRVAVHAMLDGRDTLPRSALGFMEEALAHFRGRARVASVGGRYYGMDRDKRWPRTELAYRAIAEGRGPTAQDPLALIRGAYERDVTDEFIVPTVIVENGSPVAAMRPRDAVICFNFRSDRMRQITRALADPGFDGFDVSSRPPLAVVTMTSYDQRFVLPYAFAPQSMADIVAEVLSKRGMTTFRTAETEKYAHVTYFFNGGIETPYPGEDRCLVPSAKVATYDLQPEMSAPGVTDVLCKALVDGNHDFLLCNYANGDMVGHTGSLPATIRAVETVDGCLVRVLEAARQSGTRLLITADHGNCEQMIDPATGGPHTAHTTNPVPFVLVAEDDGHHLRSGGALCDVGPTILDLLGVAVPPAMTGQDLRVAPA